MTRAEARNPSLDYVNTAMKGAWQYCHQLFAQGHAPPLIEARRAPRRLRLAFVSFAESASFALV